MDLVHGGSAGGFQEFLDHVCSTCGTFMEAVVAVAVWENDRAVRQAIRGTLTGEMTGGHSTLAGPVLYDTCFGYCFRRLEEQWGRQRGRSE